MLSMAQFGRDLAEDHIGRLIDDAGSPAPAAPGKGHRSTRLAGVLRRIADRIDPSGAHAPPEPAHDPC